MAVRPSLAASRHQRQPFGVRLTIAIIIHYHTSKQMSSLFDCVCPVGQEMKRNGHLYHGAAVTP